MPLLVLPMIIKELITFQKTYFGLMIMNICIFFNEQNFLIFEFIKFISAS